MSISSAPSLTDILVSSYLTSKKVIPVGKLVLTTHVLTPVSINYSFINFVKFPYTHTAAGLRLEFYSSGVVRLSFSQSFK